MIKSPPNSFLIACSFCLCTGLISACAEYDPDKDSAVTTQGTVDLSTIKIGSADQVFQNASVTFVRDMSASANSGGKRQYLSRGDMLGGQYVVEVKDGSCFEVDILFKDRPISKEAAEAALKALLPADAPPQSRVDDSSLSQNSIGGKAPAQPYSAVYYFGDDYLGQIFFTDKNGMKVSQVKVCNLSLLKQARADSEKQKETLKPLVEEARRAAAAAKAADLNRH